MSEEEYNTELYDDAVKELYNRQEDIEKQKYWVCTYRYRFDGDKISTYETWLLKKHPLLFFKDKTDKLIGVRSRYESSIIYSEEISEEMYKELIDIKLRFSDSYLYKAVRKNE